MYLAIKIFLRWKHNWMSLVLYIWLSITWKYWGFCIKHFINSLKHSIVNVSKLHLWELSLCYLDSSDKSDTVVSKFAGTVQKQLKGKCLGLENVTKWKKISLESCKVSIPVFVLILVRSCWLTLNHEIKHILHKSGIMKIILLLLIWFSKVLDVVQNIKKKTIPISFQ